MCVILLRCVQIWHFYRTLFRGLLFSGHSVVFPYCHHQDRSERGGLGRRARPCPCETQVPRRFLLNFLGGTPHFCHPHFFTTSFSFKYVNFAHYAGQKSRIFCLPEVFGDPKICQKCTFGLAMSPRPPTRLWSEHACPNQTPVWHSARCVCDCFYCWRRRTVLDKWKISYRKTLIY